MSISISVTGKGRRPTTYVFDQKQVTMGRSSKNDIILNSPYDSYVSRHHAIVEQRGEGEFVLIDLDSTHGTFLNRRPILGEIAINTRDMITVGADGPSLRVNFERSRQSVLETTSLVSHQSGLQFPLALDENFRDRFNFYQKIGEGGYGQVWRAGWREGSELPRQWRAVKILRPELLMRSDSTNSYQRVEKLTTRFKREAEVMEVLRRNGHTSLAQIEEIGGNAERIYLYILMEYIDGHSLDQNLVRRQPMGAEQLLRYLKQIARFLHSAHTLEWTDETTGSGLRGILHRDVKPSNIIIRQTTDEAVLVDFGIAAIAEGGTRLTMPQSRVFSYRFTAPEVLVSNELTHQTDLWGLAVTAYVLLTAGRYPYPGLSIVEMMREIQAGNLTPLSEHRPDLSPQYCHLIEKGLAARPEDRHPNALAWLAEMEKLSPGEEETASDDS